VDMRIYVIRAIRASYPTSTGECVVLLCVCVLFKPRVEPPKRVISAPVVCSTFYSPSPDSYTMTQGQTGGPWVAEPLYRN
jgi:hypothetical protein